MLSFYLGCAYFFGLGVFLTLGPILATKKIDEIPQCKEYKGTILFLIALSAFLWPLIVLWMVAKYLFDILIWM